MAYVQEENARFLKREMKLGRLDVHPNRCAIVVSYELEATIWGDYGDAMLGDRKEGLKVISLKGLSPSADVSSLAAHIVSKFPLIGPARIPEVEQLIFYLQKRHKNDRAQRRKTASKGVAEAAGRSKAVDHGGGFLEEPFEELDMEEKASLDQLESYIEMLYEDEKERVKGTGLILQLCRNPDNLEELIDNETLLGALARVLREDWKKDIQLATHIIYSFFCFSYFSVFHPAILQHKVGVTVLQAIEYEITRYDSWMALLADKKAKADATRSGSSEQKSFAKLQQQLQKQVRQQEQFLRVSIYLLLNLAEDIHVEVKMVRKNIASLLLRLLQRNNIELLILVVSFLKKLSIFRENKETMVEGDVVKKVARVFLCNHDVLISVSLRLLVNLSFDSKICEQVVKIGLLPRIVHCLGNDLHQNPALCLLYQLSLDDKTKSLFAYTDAVPLLMKIMLESSTEDLPAEAAALSVNVALCERSAELMCGMDKEKDQLTGVGLRLLMKRALQSADGQLLKVLRNISCHRPAIRRLFVPYVEDMAQMTVSCHSQEAVSDLFAILGNLWFDKPKTSADEDSEDAGENPTSVAADDHASECLRVLLTNYNFISLLKHKLSVQFPTLFRDQQQDSGQVFEALLLIVALSHDEMCAKLLADAGLLDVVITLLNDKQEDDDAVLQIVFFFYQMVFHPATRDFTIKQTKTPAYLVDLMHDKNTEVRRVCGGALDIVQEHDAVWSQNIQAERFRHFNNHWLEVIERDAMMDGDMGSPLASPYLYGVDSQDYLPLGMSLEQSLAEADSYGNGLYLPAEHWDTTGRPGTPAAFLSQGGLLSDAEMSQSMRQAELLGEPGWPMWSSDEIRDSRLADDNSPVPSTYRVASGYGNNHTLRSSATNHIS